MGLLWIGVRKTRDWGRVKGWMKGTDSNFPRQEGPPFSCDKDPLVEDRQSLESDSAPERPPGISERAAARELAGTQRPVFGVGAPG